MPQRSFPKSSPSAGKPCHSSRHRATRAEVVRPTAGDEGGAAEWSRRRLIAAAGAAATLVPGLGRSDAAAAAGRPVLLALGDSLIAGYGLAEADGFTAQLGRALAAAGTPAVIQNAGVSGDTSAGGLARIDWAIADRPTHALVCLGANDGLRGIDPADTERNLAAILDRLKAARIPVLFAGMLAPRNMGRDFVAQFDAIGPRLAKARGVRFYPFFLDGVATEPALNQPDGIHPNARGIGIIVARILPSVLDLLRATA